MKWEIQLIHFLEAELSECVTKRISRFLLSEGAPNPLLLGQFHISSLAAGGRCSLAGFSGTCSCTRLELNQENCLSKESSSFLTARDCASAGQWDREFVLALMRLKHCLF